jgi:hypothetical protein
LVLKNESESYEQQIRAAFEVKVLLDETGNSYHKTLFTSH